VERTTQGWWNGLTGVVIFSGSLPATRLAVADFDPLFLTGARAVLAGLLAAALLLAGRQERPGREDLLPLALVALGCVVGFPLLTAWALTHITSAQAMVFIGALPLSTALFSVLRGGERPRPAFWLFSVLGCGLVGGYALAQSGAGSLAGDLLMLAAIAVCGLGYAEGARLTPRLGGWQVISWSLVISLPVMLPLAWATLPLAFTGVRPSAWVGLAYVSVFSMLVGFIFWYRGLAQGGVAAVAQLQLLQPFLGMLLAALVLGEQVTWPMGLSALAVIACVAGARRYGR
jgi:drug/metabolite transporter (DMT)-like permease